MVPGLTMSASSGNLLETRNFRLQHRPTESKTLGVGLDGLCLTSPPGDFDVSSLILNSGCTLISPGGEMFFKNLMPGFCSPEILI